ncbi:HD family phosphohydrolase [Candidatus Latescibacterota bacterium]
MKPLFTRFKSQQRLGKKVDLKQHRPVNYKKLMPRIILTAVIALIISAMYISLASKSAGWIVSTYPVVSEGDIYPRREVAPFDFVVPKPQRELEQERLNAEYSALPVFTYDEEIQAVVGAEIDSLFTLVNQKMRSVADTLGGHFPSRLFGRLDYGYVDSLAIVLASSFPRDERPLVRQIKSTLNNQMSEIIVSSKEDLYTYTDQMFIFEDGEESRRVEISETYGVDEAVDLAKLEISSVFSEKLEAVSLLIVQSVVERMIRPNIFYNRERSDAEIQVARDEVSEFLISYKKNELIIEANMPASSLDIVSLEELKRLSSLYSFLNNPREHYMIAIGKILVAFGILGIFLAYIYLHRSDLFDSFSRLLLLAIITSLPLAVTFYAAWSGRLSEFLIPVAISAILTTILFDAEIGIMISMVISFLVVSIIPESGFRIGIIYFIAGGVGSVTVGRVRHRKEFYRSMYFLPLTMAVTVAATNDWLSQSGFQEVGNDMFLGAMNGFLCPIVAIGLLPLLESVFKVATDITLLELSDLNNPLLKELAVKAPGTFSSVLVVGSLAEAASEKIGANALLARVGSYYHDIGKMVIPEYFIENQLGGENPHDRLSPHMSALIIASHVKEGYELGVKYGLPDAILDIIKQHHGTSLMASIYHKAINETDDDNVDESAFRYPGPKPQSKEAAIVMLADLVEAASRSVRERSPGRLVTLINTIIQKRYTDAELNECDLTLRDLHDIEESFLPVLVGSQHGRIEYPWQQKENTDKAEIKAVEETNEKETKQSTEDLD